jgi:hypothetical protein
MGFVRGLRTVRATGSQITDLPYFKLFLPFLLIQESLYEVGEIIALL